MHNKPNHQRLVLAHMSPHEVDELSLIQGGHHRDNNGVYHLAQTWDLMKRLGGVDKLSDGGAVDSTTLPPHLQKFSANNGIHGDTRKVAMPYEMAKYLDQSIGGVSQNPHDGMRQYYMGQGVVNGIKNWWDSKTNPAHLPAGYEGPQMIPTLSQRAKTFWEGGASLPAPGNMGPADDSRRARWGNWMGKQGRSAGEGMGTTLGGAAGAYAGQSMMDRAIGHLPGPLAAVASIPARMMGAKLGASHGAKSGANFLAPIGEKTLSAIGSTAGDAADTVAKHAAPYFEPGTMGGDFKDAAHQVGSAAMGAARAAPEVAHDLWNPMDEHEGSNYSYAQEYPPQATPHQASPELNHFRSRLADMSANPHMYQNPDDDDDGHVFYDAQGDD